MFLNKRPKILRVDENIILTKKTKNFEFALSWYTDKETVRLLSGENEDIYTMDEINRMYKYQNLTSELYFIEYLIDGEYKPIGDVGFSKHDLPIVIGDKNFRGKKIGQKVLNILIDRGKSLKYQNLFVKEVFNYNIASQKLFESVGFLKYKDTQKGLSYILNL